jgi:hypothetical protein
LHCLLENGQLQQLFLVTEKLGLELVESLMPTLIQMTAMFQVHAAKAFQV